MILTEEDAQVIKDISAPSLDDLDDASILAAWRVTPAEQEMIARYPQAATATGDDLVTVRLALSYLVAASSYAGRTERIASDRIGDEALTFVTGIENEISSQWRDTAWRLLAGLWPDEAPPAGDFDDFPFFALAHGQRGRW